MFLGRSLRAWPLFLLGVLPISIGAQTRMATPVREADAVCGRCHEQIFKSYLMTPMANGSGLASERFYPGSYQHAPSGVEYMVSNPGGQPTLSYTLPATAAATTPVTTSEQLQYFLGSGHLGLTYLYSKNGYLLESPIAYYSNLQGYAMKPGFQRTRELPPALTLNPSCLRCHMSAVQKQEPGTDNLYRGLPFEHTGITCESCHGDARQHVASNGKIAVVNPIKLSPERRDSTCSVCHLEGDTSVEHRDRSVLDYKPGDDISDILSYFVYVGENTTHRAVSEIEQFSSSRCRIVSGPAMSCMNCHDPHSSPKPEERAAFFRGKCVACHTEAKFATGNAAGHYASNPDCTSCHMPRTGSENIPHVAWTDHRIRQHPEQTDAASTQTATRELVAVFPGANTPRDLALAYYNLVVAKGISAERPRAWQLLTAAEKTSPDDVALLRALGITAQLNGDTTRAETYYRAVLQKDPESLAAGTNLGTLLAKAGNIEAAATVWKTAFNRNADVPELGHNLAKAQCMLGLKDDAVQTLKTVLLYSPGLMRSRQDLAEIESGQQPCSRIAGQPVQ